MVVLTLPLVSRSLPSKSRTLFLHGIIFVMPALLTKLRLIPSVFVPGHPYTGQEEIEICASEFTDPHKMVQVLQGYGFPKTRDRVFLEFLNFITSSKGKGLVDCVKLRDCEIFRLLFKNIKQLGQYS